MMSVPNFTDNSQPDTKFVHTEKGGFSNVYRSVEYGKCRAVKLNVYRYEWMEDNQELYHLDSRKKSYSTEVSEWERLQKYTLSMTKYSGPHRNYLTLTTTKKLVRLRT
jgi:hypothetical protein